MADYGTADFTGFVDCLWPTAEELALPPSFSVHDDPAGGGFLLDDFDFFGAAAGPSDEDFVRLLLLGDDATDSDAAAKPTPPRPQRSDSGAKPLTPARRRNGSPPNTPEKSEGKASQKSERRYWTEDERAKFHAAMRQHGADFNEISKFVGTRTSTQVRTHVQKYHLKLVREYQASKRKAASEAAAAAADDDAAAQKLARF